ncbi:hypothetical protein QFC19_009268 [Naganishia cerealis]|uniref:Uncharacterized protein n=1 Tax=Naganishia cerealis TaxID=610337 RepID=A0ACC2UWJ9_9TREE|nr:hypothetical protein QFC19_009268 [Naganishia cerealis]
MASQTARKILSKNGSHTDDDVDGQDDNDNSRSHHRETSRRRERSRTKSSNDRSRNDHRGESHDENHMKSPGTGPGDKVIDLDDILPDVPRPLAARKEALTGEKEAAVTAEEALRQRRKERKKRKAAKAEAAEMKDKRLASSSDDEDTRPVTEESARRGKHPKGSKQKLRNDSGEDEYFLREKSMRSERLRKEEQERRRLKARRLREEREDLEDEEELELNQRHRRPLDRRMENDREEMARARRSEQEGDFERVEPLRQRRRQPIRNFADQAAEEDGEEYLPEYGGGPPQRRTARIRGGDLSRSRNGYGEREVDSGYSRGDRSSGFMELNDQAGYQHSSSSASNREVHRRQGMSNAQSQPNEGHDRKGRKEAYDRQGRNLEAQEEGLGQGVPEEPVIQPEDGQRPVIDERKALEEKRLNRKREKLERLLQEQEKSQEKRLRRAMERKAMDSKAGETNTKVLSDQTASEMSSQTTPAITPQPTEAEANTANHLQDPSVSENDQRIPLNEFSSNKVSAHMPSQALSAVQPVPSEAIDTTARLEKPQPPISKGEEPVLLQSLENASHVSLASRPIEATTPKLDVSVKEGKERAREPEIESSLDEIPPGMFSEKAPADPPGKAKKAKRREVLGKNGENESETDIHRSLPTVKPANDTGIRLNDSSAPQGTSRLDVLAKEDIKSSQVPDKEPTYERISSRKFSESSSAGQPLPTTNSPDAFLEGPAPAKEKEHLQHADSSRPHFWEPPVAVENKGPVTLNDSSGRDGLWKPPKSKSEEQEKRSEPSSEKLPSKMTSQPSSTEIEEPNTSDPHAPFEGEGPTKSLSKEGGRQATSGSSQQGGSELPPFYDNVYRGPESLQDSSAPPPEYGKAPPGDKTLVASQDAPEDYYPPSSPSRSRIASQDTSSKQRTQNRPGQPGNSDAGDGSSKWILKTNKIDLADVSAPDSEGQQDSVSKPSSSSASIDVKEAIAGLGRKSSKSNVSEVGSSSSHPEEKRKVHNNGYNRSEIPDFAARGGNHLREPLIVNRVEFPDDRPLTKSPNYVDSGKNGKETEIVEAAVKKQEAQKQIHEVNQYVEPPDAIHLEDSRKAKKKSPSTSESYAEAFRSNSEFEMSDSIKDNFKRLCHNAKLCKKRTTASVLFFAAYIAFTYAGSSYVVIKSPSVTASNVVKRQAFNTTGIEETVSSVTDAFQDTGYSLGTLQSHPLLISNLWHLFSQFLILYLISSIYIHTPVEEEARSEKSESQPRKAGGSWWTRITDRVTSTRAWFQRRLGRWSFARYAIILALFGISILVARQLTSLSYISRNPSATEPWSTYPDVALLYGRLRASQKGLASGVTLVQASICFWFVVVFTGAYCISTLADEPVPAPRDIEQGKGSAEV